MYSRKENASIPVTNNVKSVVKSKESRQPYVRIVEQPRSRGLRFRYPCENRQSAVIEGENSSSLKKTYPTIEVVNNQRPFYVVVSCVTKDRPHRPHPHSLSGKGKEFSHGICYMKMPAGENVVEFPRMTIQCVKKNEIVKALEERKRLKVDPFRTGYSEYVKNVNLSCVRLCFQVFLEGEQKGNFNKALTPVVTQPIYDKKTSVEFEIKWISHHSASVAGGKVICIISDKLVKDDIQVIFLCEKSGWEATAEFTRPFFHKQVAVVVKTPPYLDKNVTEHVNVQVMLRRPSTGATSTPVPFELFPVEVERRDSKRVKRLRLCTTPRNLIEQHVQDHQAALQPSKIVNGASKTDRVLQMQRRQIVSQHTAKVERSNPSEPLRKFSNAYNFQVPCEPKVSMEFKQVFQNYTYSDYRRDFFS